MRGYLFVIGLALLSFCLFAQASLAFDTSKMRPHLTFNLGSYHVNANQRFEEFNPGLGIGFTYPTGWKNTEAGLELGQYRNSLGDQSYYLMGSLDAPVAQVTHKTELRLGVFGGFAHYPGQSSRIKSSGVPSIGNWILAAGGQATLRMDERTDLRLRVMPAGDVADALVTLQMAIRF